MKTIDCITYCGEDLLLKIMAERMGFEPMIEFPLYTLSKRAPSTTRPPLQNTYSLFILKTPIKAS